MKNTILISKDKPAIQVLIISFFVQLFGVLLISNSSWIWWQILIGTILLFIGMIVITIRSELHFDFKSNTLIVKWANLFFSKHKIEKLPEIDYLSIIRVKTTKNLNYKSITTQESGYMCNVNLIYKNSNERFKKLCTIEKEKAFHLAKELSKNINKPILDISTPNKKWINK